MATFKFPRFVGLTNTFATTNIPPKFARDIVNCDIDSLGRISVPRPGTLRVYSGSACHSWFEYDDGFGVGLFVEGDSLKRLNRDYSATVLATPGPMEMSYVEFNGSVYYSNGVVFGRYKNGAVSPVGVPGPLHQPSAAPTTSGGMYAGTYGVAIRWLRNGEASGTGKSTYVDVEDGGGITLTGFPPAPSLVDEMEVFVSRPNGEELYYYDTFPVNTGFIAIRYSREATPLDTQFLKQSVPGLGLTIHNGRLHWLSGNRVGRSVPFRLGLTESLSGLIFPAPTTNIISISGADAKTLFVTTTESVFRVDTMEGQDKPTVVLPYGIVRGAFSYDRARSTAFIFGERGVVALTQEGVKELHADAFSPAKLLRATSAVIPSEGYDKMVVVGPPSGELGRLQHSDY